MANKEALKFQEALANKIKSWEKTQDFADGSSNKQKLNRSLNLLLGSDPDVVVDMLGGDFVPDNPREAMNLIRGLDLKTLKSMEILDLKGLGNKLVGHHGIAASTLQNLRFMPPKERLKVYKGLADMGQRFGMDPQQIFLIADKIHKPIAHRGDFTGVKTGVQLPYIVGETGDEFLKRFEEPMRLQLQDLENAVAAGETQDYYKAINTVEDNLQIPRGTLTSPDTPIPVKDAATKLLKPTANQIREVVNAGEDIAGGTQRILDETPLKPKALTNFYDVVKANGSIKLGFNLSKLAVPAAAGGVLLSGIGVQAAEEQYQEDPSFIHDVQRKLAATELAADTVAVGATAAAPATAGTSLAIAGGAEIVSMGAGLTNLVIDGGKAFINMLSKPNQPTEEYL